jgi:hypothetical protein
MDTLQQCEEIEAQSSLATELTGNLIDEIWKWISSRYFQDSSSEPYSKPRELLKTLPPFLTQIGNSTESGHPCLSLPQALALANIRRQRIAFIRQLCISEMKRLDLSTLSIKKKEAILQNTQSELDIRCEEAERRGMRLVAMGEGEMSVYFPTNVGLIGLIPLR